MSSQLPIPPRTTRASARARQESNKHIQATSSYSQVYRKSSVAPKPASMSVDRLPTFLNEPNTAITSCQTYEPAAADPPLPLPEKSRLPLIDRCYVLLTPLKKTSSSSGSASQSHVSPVRRRSTHTRTASQSKQRGEPVSGANSNFTRADREPNESEGHASSKQDSDKRGPPRNAARRTSNSQSLTREPPTSSREVQIASRPGGFISHTRNQISGLVMSALATIGVFVVFVLAWYAYQSLNQSSCAVFCSVPA